MQWVFSLCCRVFYAVGVFSLVQWFFSPYAVGFFLMQLGFFIMQ